jgi:hypothetical protein
MAWRKRSWLGTGAYSTVLDVMWIQEHKFSPFEKTRTDSRTN